MHRKFMAVAGCREGRERGFVLVTMAVAAIALIGVLGLAVDLGHMFISKNETQAYCDSAALAAALALDGTTEWDRQCEGGRYRLQQRLELQHHQRKQPHRHICNCADRAVAEQSESRRRVLRS